MNFPEDIESKLGFDEIRTLLRTGCRSNGGKLLVDRMKFSSNHKLVMTWLNQASEYKELVAQNTQPVISSIDLTVSLNKLTEKHTILEVDEFLEVRQLCIEVGQLLEFFEPRKEKYVELIRLIEGIQSPDDLIESISRVFNDQGQWRKNASKKLSVLLDEIEMHQREAYSIIQKIYNQASGKKWTAETEITVKDGRLVIPIFAEHKRKLKGIVHDESGGGKILYIEPIEVLEASNRQKELEMERDREMKRILQELSKETSLYFTDLKTYNQRMAVFDLIRSKAELADRLGAQLPEVKKSSDATIHKMFHPLLFLSNAGRRKETIPLDIAFSETHRLFVISGPNAGGKSVAIKTVALNQYMLQSGVLPCCREDSVMGFYKQIFVDIGDNQSIENDLSSYSSHLTAMKYFLQKSNASTLLIIDEIGSGTDPNFGGAMAEAIILELNKKKPRGLITTHFGNVKSIAKNEDGIDNACMLYDTRHLKPLYKLEVGKPGSSFALEVAQNIGLPQHIIKAARKRSNIKQQKTDELLASLEIERKEISDKLLDINEKQAYVDKLKKEYAELKNSVETARKDILENAKAKALQLMDDANAEIERTIKTIKESSADKKKTSSARKKLEEKKAKVSGTRQKEKEPSTPAEDLRIGSEVMVPNTSIIGEIIEIRKDKAVVLAGIMKSTYALSDLKPVKGRKQKKKSKVEVGFVKRQEGFRMEKDVRGMRAEEALKEIDRWIDDAIVIGANNLRLIHGKGDGVLKKIIRDYYHNKSYIKRISYEDVRLGGEGVSIIELA